MRVIHKRRILGDEPREVWVRMLHKVVEFSGLELITYCILKNHAHVLVRVDPGARDCSDGELVGRFGVLYGDTRAAWCGLDVRGFAHALSEGDTPEAKKLRERMRARMGDISEFMRTLRQRYTKWFNHTHGTVGTLWAERFGSVLVQDIPWLVGLVAAYIDLNPVRAGLASLPEDYRWSGYTEALAGHKGLRHALVACFPRSASERQGLANYRLFMLGRGMAAKRDGSGARIDPAAYLEAVRNGGELQAHELLRLKLRFVSQGLALGDRLWLEKGEGGKALAKLRKPCAPSDLEVLSNESISLAHRTRSPGIDLPA